MNDDTQKRHAQAAVNLVAVDARLAEIDRQLAALVERRVELLRAKSQFEAEMAALGAEMTEGVPA